MRHASAYFCIALGSALGGVGRYWLSEYVIRRAGDSFPWGTLVVNVSGSFLIGLLAALVGPDSPSPASLNTRLLLMVGICGGYTTFSSFSLQTLALLQKGALLPAGANVVCSVVFCLLATWLGVLAGQLAHR
jgi:CrcB protein